MELGWCLPANKTQYRRGTVAIAKGCAELFDTFPYLESPHSKHIRRRVGGRFIISIVAVHPLLQRQRSSLAIEWVIC